MFIFFVASCTIEDVDDTLKIDHTGGLIDVQDTNINYVVGNSGPYSINVLVRHGSSPSNVLEVYKTFVNNKGESSNTELLKTIELNGTNVSEAISFDVNFDELISGLVFDGEPLPTTDTGLDIGDGFILTYKAITDTGDSSTSITTTKLTVSTRFAGKYRVITDVYYRIGVLRDDVSWDGNVVQIESVDAITYKHIGLAVWGDNAYYFTIEDDNITVLKTDPSGAGVLLNGEPILTCEQDGANLTSVPCGDSSNYVVKDDVNGKDKIYITVGYLTGAGDVGPREFYEVLEKIVE